MAYEKIPFNADEMKSEETYRLPFPGAPGIIKPKYPITSKENFYRAIKGEPAWIPSDIEFFLFAPSTIIENVTRGMVIEAKRLSPDQYGGKDFFGVEWVFIPEQRGSMVKPGNPMLEEACEWKEKIVFPDLSTWDWEDCAERNKFLLGQGRPVKMTIYTGFFERLISFMDMEGALVALIDEDQQDDVKELFDKLADFYIEMIGYMKKYFGLDVLWFHDDWGSQRAPMFSYNTVEEMILPYLKRVVDAAHEMGVIFEFHSCGMVEPLVPLMAEAGIDFWDGQEMNDKVKLAEEYRGQLSIEIETQLHPEMSDDELREYVKEMLDKYEPGVFLSKTFRSDPRLTPIAYELSRIKYNS